MFETYIDQHQKPGEILSGNTLRSAKELMHFIRQPYPPANSPVTHIVLYRADMLPLLHDIDNPIDPEEPQLPLWRPVAEVLAEIQSQMAQPDQ